MQTFWNTFLCVCVWERQLQGHQTVFEMEDCAEDKDQDSQGIDFNSLDSLSHSPALYTPNTQIHMFDKNSWAPSK